MRFLNIPLVLLIFVFRMSDSISNLRRSHDHLNIFDGYVNLTQITWAHAVNNRSYLESNLQSDVNMLEADIVLGTLTTSTNTTQIPIMAHPPANTSDLSLKQFLSRVQEYNNVSTTEKGVKLDFKTIEVFEASLDTLAEAYSKIEFPFWLNADIIAGPLNATTTPVDPERFFSGSSRFINATLSIGWTTNYGNNITEASYTKDQIESMLAAINKYNPTQIISFPVRAGIAAESLTNMQYLLNSVPNSTLTVWSSAGDNVNIDKLRTLILTIGVDKVYIDVPEEISNELDLSTSNVSRSHSSYSLPTLIGLISLFHFRLF